MLNLAYLKIKNSCPIGMFFQLECSSNRTQLQYIYTHGRPQRCMGYFLQDTRPSLVWTSLSRTSDYPDSTQLFGCALKLYSQIFTYPNRGRSQICEGLLYTIDSMQQCRCVLRFFYTSYPQTPNKIRCALNGIPLALQCIASLIEIIHLSKQISFNGSRIIKDVLYSRLDLDCSPPPPPPPPPATRPAVL